MSISWRFTAPAGYYQATTIACATRSNAMRASSMGRLPRSRERSPTRSPAAAGTSPFASASSSTVAVSSSEGYLVANEGANSLVVLTEGFQSALVACVVLAGIGVALALTLLGTPRKAPHQRLEPLRRPAARNEESRTSAEDDRCRKAQSHRSPG